MAFAICSTIPETRLVSRIDSVYNVLQRRHPLKKTVAVLFILSLLASPCQAADPLTVARVIDGDILELSSGETVRLLGIDCEENKYGPEEAAFANTGKKFKRSPDSVRQAKEAAEFTRKLVEGKQVRLEYDVQKKDKYGRTLAYVYVDIGVVKTLQNVKTGEISSQPAADWIFLNEEIIKRGYAQVMTIPPNVKHAELFVKLEKDARENKRGLWES